MDSKYYLSSYDYTKHPDEAYLRPQETDLVGLAPHGFRHGSFAPKASGYYGYLPVEEGVSTEISSEDRYGREYPLMVPTLSREELDTLLKYQGDPAYTPDRVYEKAHDWAEQRRAAGQNTFADTTSGLRYPVPERVEFGYDQELLRKVLQDVEAAFSK